MLGYRLRAALGFACLLVTVCSPSLGAQGEGFKDFNRFKGILPGVDFFASNRQAVTPFEKPVAETQDRLKNLLSQELPPGAIFVCSTLAQKDAVYEPRAVKMGFSWMLSVLTPEARSEEMMVRLKQSGVDIPPDRLERMRNRSKEMRPMIEAGMARTAARDMALAILQRTLAPDTEFRLSRIDDTGRTPLPDWLDIGIASYVSGSGSNLRFLQQHLEEVFPLEDMLTMARPFVAPGADGSGAQTAIRIERPAGASGQGPGADQMGGAPGAGSGGRTGGPRTLPKDQQDRMLFDSQAAAFFAFLLENAGIDKVKELIAIAGQKKDPMEFIRAIPAIGQDFDKVEEDWVNWVKVQKPDPSQDFRMRTGGERTARPQ